MPEFPVLPSPQTWPFKGPVRATRLRQDVADTVALLASPPLFAGAQTVTAQSIPAFPTVTGVTLDTEYVDGWNMHQDGSTHPDRCYPPFAGWYLAQAYTPISAASSGDTACYIRAVQGGGAQTDYGGQTLPNNSSSTCGPVAAKLVQISSPGPYGTGDYAGMSAGQGSSGSLSLQVTGSSFPRFTMRWIAALSGTTGLPVPPVAPWPAPPFWVTSAFLNANIRDTINFLIYPPFGEWTYNAGTQTLASQTGLPLVQTPPLPLDTTVADNYSAMNFGLGAPFYTVPVNGVYFVYVMNAVLATTTTVAVAAGATVSSANYNGGNQVTLWNGTQAATANPLVYNNAVFRRKLRLNAGDKVMPAGFQHDTASAALTIGGNSPSQTRMIIAWTGA